jgi:hypothetical protein
MTSTYTHQDQDNPDVWNVRSYDKEHGEDWWEQCPICYSNEGLVTCECDASDTTCENGHHWHYHRYHDTNDLVKVFHVKGVEKYSCPHNNRDDTNSCHC